MSLVLRAPTIRLAWALAVSLVACASGLAQERADGGVPAVPPPTTSLGAEEGQKGDPIAVAEKIEGLHTLIVALDGEIVIEEGFESHSTTAPTNIKSASKSIVSALVGIAIEKGLLEGVDQPIAPFFAENLPDEVDPRLEEITIGHLLTMRAGLKRTSGAGYGAWIASENWVRAALAQPFVAEPGGRMLYSTGSTHLLSAILTEVAGRDTMALANDWLSMDGAFRVTDWLRDPQGIPLGGNQVAVSPRALLAFGEMYRNDGRWAGEQIVPAEWVAESWQPRTRSAFSGEQYGYSWFIRELAGYDTYYAWGYGGQMLYILPELKMTAVITSDPNRPSGRNGYKDDLHRYVADHLVAFAVAKDADEH